MKWRGPRLAISMAAFLLIAACSVEATISHPACDGAGSWVIVAQSVPSASKVPCLDPLPPGWDIETVRINEDGTEIAFDSDRAGPSAARMHFTRSCDVGQAIPSPREYPDTDRFEIVREMGTIFHAARYHRFDGGCVWWEFEFDEGAPSALSIELTNSMQLMDRTELQRLIADNFVDELL